MPNKIQLKRGNKSNMPILAVGEPAFSTNTKELFIGDGTTNQYFNNANENLIINGNFQVVYEDFDVSTGNIIIIPGKSKYIYGNFYLSNDVTSTGNITISKPINGMVTISSTNAKMTLEYRERLPEYKTGIFDNYAYTFPFLNQLMTLSFDYQNNGSDVSFLTGNGVDNFTSLILKNENNNLSNTFTMKYKQKGSDYYMGILLLRNTTNLSYQVSVGNFKLELGNMRTSFLPNPLYLDILALEQVYKIYNTTTRSANINSSVFNYYIYLDTPFCLTNKFSTITVNTADVYSLDGIKQTGFTINKPSLSPYMLLQIQATKQNNLLNENYLVSNFTLDLRVY